MKRKVALAARMKLPSNMSVSPHCCVAYCLVGAILCESDIEIYHPVWRHHSTAWHRFWRQGITKSYRTNVPYYLGNLSTFIRSCIFNYSGSSLNEPAHSHTILDRRTNSSSKGWLFLKLQEIRCRWGPAFIIFPFGFTNWKLLQSSPQHVLYSCSLSAIALLISFVQFFDTLFVWWNQRQYT